MTGVQNIPEDKMKLINNPAALFMEAFRSSESLKKHADIISDEQKRILQYYDEMKVDPPISREEVEEFMRFI